MHPLHEVSKERYLRVVEISRFERHAAVVLTPVCRGYMRLAPRLTWPSMGQEFIVAFEGNVKDILIVKIFKSLGIHFWLKKRFRID